MVGLEQKIEDRDNLEIWAWAEGYQKEWVFG